MNEPTAEEWFYIIDGVLFFIWGIAIFLFGRISIKHIEQEMAKEGKLSPEYDKGIGARGILYVMEIVLHRFFSKKHRVELIDVEATMRHARKKDWYLALFLLVSFAAFMIVMCVGYYLYAPQLYYLLVPILCVGTATTEFNPVIKFTKLL